MPTIETIIKQRQTVIDFTCQHAGAMEEAFNLALSNGIGITDAVASGTVLKAEVVEPKVTAVFNGQALDITTDEQVRLRPGGIGYMQIGTSFKVS